MCLTSLLKAKLKAFSNFWSDFCETDQLILQRKTISALFIDNKELRLTEISTNSLSTV